MIDGYLPHKAQGFGARGKARWTSAPQMWEELHHVSRLNVKELKSSRHALDEAAALLRGRTIRVEADLVDQLFNSSENALPASSAVGELWEGRKT